MPRAAIDAAATRLPAQRALVWLERALLDPARPVRDTAHFHLSRHSTPTDVPQFYRDALGRHLPPRVRAAALAGLSQTGTTHDALVALGFFDHDRPVVRRAAIRAVARPDAERHINHLTEMLRDPSPSVTRAAADALRPLTNLLGIDGIRAALRVPAPPHRVHAASLAVGLGKWTALLALLELADDADREVRQLVGTWLADWVARQNRAYTPPTAAQLEGIQRRLPHTVPPSRQRRAGRSSAPSRIGCVGNRTHLPSRQLIRIMAR